MARRAILAGAVLATLLAAVSYTLVVTRIAGLRDAVREARASDETLSAADQLERLILDVETAERGFLISGDDRFLAPWNRSRGALPEQGRVLERLAAGRDAGQSDRARRLVAAAQGYIDEYSVPTVDRALGNPAAARTVATALDGKRRADALRADFDGFAAVEYRLAQAREDQAGTAARRAIVAGVTGVGGSILLVIAGSAYLMIAIVVPVRRAAAMAGELAALDLSVRMPESGPAEIGALERAFNTMAASLQSSRDDLGDLLEEQAALRRVATLVARAVPPQEVFCAVVSEVCDLLGADATSLLSYEPDGTATVVANRHPRADVNLPVGARLNLAGDNVTGAVLQTGRPARMDSYDRAPGLLAARMRAIGVRAAAGTPIVVDGQLWGTIAAFTRTAFPPGVECRLAGFTELVAAAIANAESRAELAASRARVIAAADQTRRLIERDLHDGIQQRLVSLALEIRAAGMMVAPDHDELRMQLSGVSRGLAGAMDDLREISRGIHPAILSTDGLPPALKTLARRSVVPVRLSVGLDERLPDGHEVALYYVVSEALTNAAKHAQASVVHVDLRLDGEAVHLSITDDGVGGADPSAGSGLVGLKDRIGALGGRIDIASPPGGGTTLLITVPLPARQPSRAG